MHSNATIKACSHFHSAYLSVQLTTICAVIKSKCAAEKDNVCTKKCRDSGQNYDLRVNYPDLCSWKYCLKYTLLTLVLTHGSVTAPAAPSPIASWTAAEAVNSGGIG